MKNLTEMSVKELEEHKQQLYTDNTNNGNINKLVTIARVLGANLHAKYGPKYSYREGNIEIYVDDYGHYSTVRIGDKLKVSTHSDRLYAPGEWEEIIERLYPEAKRILDERAAKNEEQKKSDLLDKLL